MKRTDFLERMKSPLPTAVLKGYPNGNIQQFWGQSSQLYATAFGHMDDLHQYLEGHSGVDIATFQGDEVVAAHDGTVDIIYTDPNGLGGKTIFLISEPLDEEEPGNSFVQTAYAHLDEILVTQGQKVKQGDIIGKEGNTGFVISGTQFWKGGAPPGHGVHLHFGLHELIKKNGAITQRYNNLLQGTSDPLPYLTGDWTGTISLLQSALALLKKWLGR